MRHVARGTWAVIIPPAAAAADLEYYVEVSGPPGQTLRMPATAPQLNNTVVVVPGSPRH